MLDINKIFLFDSVGPLYIDKHNPGIVIQTQIKPFLAVSSMQQQKDGKCIICSEMRELVLALVLGHSFQQSLQSLHPAVRGNFMTSFNKNIFTSVNSASHTFLCWNFQELTQWSNKYRVFSKKDAV